MFSLCEKIYGVAFCLHFTQSHISGSEPKNQNYCVCLYFHLNKENNARGTMPT